jgi:hypothetical protein
LPLGSTDWAIPGSTVKYADPRHKEKSKTAAKQIKSAGRELGDLVFMTSSYHTRLKGILLRTLFFSNLNLGE